MRGAVRSPAESDSCVGPGVKESGMGEQGEIAEELVVQSSETMAFVERRKRAVEWLLSIRFALNGFQIQ